MNSPIIKPQLSKLLTRKEAAELMDDPEDNESPISKALGIAEHKQFLKLTGEFRDMMLTRLSEKQDDGFTGWDEKERMENFILRIIHKSNSLFILSSNKQLIRKRCVDIAALAMFIWNLNQDDETEESEESK